MTQQRVKFVAGSKLINPGFGHLDGVGSDARFYLLNGVAVDSNGHVYIADTGNHTIRKVTSSGVVTTFAGAAILGVTEFLQSPESVAVDSANFLYVADTANNMIRKISPSGVISTLAGAKNSGSTNGTGSAARFNSPSGVAVDSSGNVYVAD
ncbi:MAG: hypothetical protein ACK4VO_09875, partial [Pseudobdellovibrio sp.]